MKFPILFRLSCFLFAAFVLSGCGEQGIQLEESALLRYLEEQSGLIALQAMDGNLYTINQAGENKIQITDDAEGMPMDVIYNLRNFSWSPASNQLAYVGFTPEMWTIEVADPLGETRTQIFSDNLTQPIHLSWSGDGDHVSFLTSSDPLANNGAMQMILRSQRTAGGGEPAILAEGFPIFYSWEPEGDRALTHIGGSRENNENARISIASIDSNFERDLGLAPSQFQAPAWSPIGTEMLMAIDDIQGRKVLAIVSLQGQVRQTVTEFDTAIAFAWSPDGRYVGYIESERTRQGSSGQLIIYDSVERETLFTTEETLVHAFIWSPDSEEVVYFTQELIEEEGRGELVAGLRMHILNVEDAEVRHIQFGPEAYVFQPTPQFFRFLTLFDQYQQSATIWSPNGDYIVLPVVSNQQGLILAVATSGGIQPRVLSDGIMAIWSWE